MVKGAFRIKGRVTSAGEAWTRLNNKPNMEVWGNLNTSQLESLLTWEKINGTSLHWNMEVKDLT